MDLCADLITFMALKFVKLDNGVVMPLFFPTVHSLIGYFEVTSNLNVSLGSTLRNIEILGKQN